MKKRDKLTTIMNKYLIVVSFFGINKAKELNKYKNEVLDMLNILDECYEIDIAKLTVGHHNELIICVLADQDYEELFNSALQAVIKRWELPNDTIGSMVIKYGIEALTVLT